MKNRWYDSNPVISLAIKLLEKSNSDTQDYCAKYIIEEARSTGVSLEIENINEKYSCFWQRWQDSSTKLFEAMEYFRLAEFNSKKEISLGVIRYIENLERNLN